MKSPNQACTDRDRRLEAHQLLVHVLDATLVHGHDQDYFQRGIDLGRGGSSLITSSFLKIVAVIEPRGALEAPQHASEVGSRGLWASLLDRISHLYEPREPFSSARETVVALAGECAAGMGSVYLHSRGDRGPCVVVSWQGAAHCIPTSFFVVLVHICRQR